jgi:hypothetical protein
MNKMKLLLENWRQYMIEAAEDRKSMATLYHIGPRPAEPKPRRAGWGPGDWERSHLDKPIRSGVFLSPNPGDIAYFHGVRGANVYVYKIAFSVIKEAGQVNRYDSGSEVLIPEDLWYRGKHANKIIFQGRSKRWEAVLADQDKYDRPARSRAEWGPSYRPGWMSPEEWEKDRSVKSKRDHLQGLRATKHPEAAIKIMSDEKRSEALAAFEEEHEGERERTIAGQRVRYKLALYAGKDAEVMALLRKYLAGELDETTT